METVVFVLATVIATAGWLARAAWDHLRGDR